MNNQSYLTFRLKDLTYGIEANLVKEIFPLPELTIIPETPADIIGAIYLRDRLVPIMHLDRRLGQPIQECILRDRVILIEWNSRDIGIIVNEVLDVVNVNAENLETTPDYGRESRLNTAFVANLAKVNNQSLILLNTQALITKPDELEQKMEETTSWKENTPDKSELLPSLGDFEGNTPANFEPIPLLGNFFDTYCPNATLQDKDIFRERAEELAQSLEGTHQDLATKPLAVFYLGEKYFGCDLGLVKEFVNIQQISPIPCSPKHILGHINLRGEIIPIVDISHALNFAEAVTSSTKAIIVQIEDIIAGIVVDEIFDVLYLKEEQIIPNPSGMANEVKQYFQGITDYNDSYLSAIDLSKLFADKILVT